MPPSLQTLPPKVQREITSYLPCDGRRALKHTNRAFFSSVSLDILELVVFEVTPWAIKNKLLVCKPCDDFRHESKFGDAQRSKHRCRGGTQVGLRFCVDCGLNGMPTYLGYCRGTMFKWLKKTYFVKMCLHCKDRFMECDKRERYGWCQKCKKSVGKREGFKMEDKETIKLAVRPHEEGLGGAIDKEMSKSAGLKL